MADSPLRLSTCTMQLKSGGFCDRPADDRFPNRICAHHAIKVYLSVKDFIADLDPTVVTDLVTAGALTTE